MGRKPVNKTVKPIVDVDSLVNEGKNIDMDKVNEVIAESEKKQEEETKADEKKVEEISEDTNFIQVAETNEEPIEEKEAIVEDTVTPTAEETEEENIDDVIAECTGESEEIKEETIDIDESEEDEICEDTSLHMKKKEQPWYVARAMRGNDYFSW